MADEKQTQTKSAQGGRSASDAGEAQVQQAFDEANAKGYFGTVPDETPNSEYTLAGVTKAAKERS